MTHLVSELDKFGDTSYRLSSEMKLDEQLFIIEALTEEIQDRMDDFYNTLVLGKNGIINTKLINVKLFMNAYEWILRKNMLNLHIPAEMNHFQTIIDISRLKTALHNGKIIYQISIPILEDKEWQVIKYYVIPKKIGNTFLAPILNHEIAIQQHEHFIFVDEPYLLRHCRDTPIGSICVRTQPTQQRTDANECVNPMHGKRTDYTKCPTAVFQIKGLTFVPLHTPNTYILLPEKPITIQLFCKLNMKHTITQPTVIKSNEDCIVFFDQNVMKIGGITSETNI